MKFTWESEVRVNETDMQGIVNNANYFIYMTHARCLHLKACGIDFNKLHEEGLDLVLVHTDISFKDSLKNGDEFIVTSAVKPNGKIRYDFEQEVIRKADGKVVAIAVNTGVCLNRNTGKPVIPEFMQVMFDSYKL
jgi:acyl-CoA thioester hydrolase